MKKYATVDTEKSTRIFISALTWLLRRTVPSSRNAKPACIASTMIAPSRMNKTSADVLCSTICSPLSCCGRRRRARSGTQAVAPSPEQQSRRIVEGAEPALDVIARDGRLAPVQRLEELAPRIACLAPLRSHLVDEVLG